MRVLVAEADPRVAGFARGVLHRRGHEVRIVRTGTEAIGAGGHDEVVVDASLPDMTGFEACRRLREAGDWTSVLVLVDRGAPTDPVRASGADGLLRKPFSGWQLLQALPGTREVLRVDGVELDRSRRIMRRDDVAVRLSPIEFALLDVLVEGHDRVVERDVLLAHAWSYDYANTSNVVDVYLRRLREKLAPAGTFSIETVRGRGYCLALPDA
jgi:two-component system OmpR family response regulator